MSSPKAARTTRRAAHPAAKRVPAQPAAKPASKITNGAAGSAEAKRLAAELERALASGRRDVLSTDALQALMAAVCKTYAAQIEAGEQLLPLSQREPGSVRTWHVAELDRPLTFERGFAREEFANGFWKRQETTHGPPR
jgi:hypothetical protein